MVVLARPLLVLLCSAALMPPALAAETARAPRDDTLARCSWDRPGRNAFTGDVVAAIDRYRDIPTPVRQKLKQRMAAREYDDLVDIRRDRIEGKFQYASAIREMHFGRGTVCREVSRERWTDKMHERGLVYCESAHCILVPTVCRNVSRIDRALPLVAGDRLMAPPGSVPADALPPGDRRETAAAAAPPAPATASVPEAVPPVTSSFAESVAGAAVPLFPVPGGTVPLGDGTPPGGLIAQTPTDGAPPTGDASSLPFPPMVFVPGGGSGIAPPDGGGGDGGGGGGGGDGGGGGGGGGGGQPVDPGTPPVTPIPEPSTWALLVAGLAMLAWTVRRQRRAVVVAEGPAGAPKCATQKRS
jgi:uncharacterized membrane protein YgcG